MSDYAGATGAPRNVTIQGREYTVPKLRPRDVGELDAWIRDQVPNPLTEARRHMEGLPDAVACHVWDRAAEEYRRWPPRVDDDEGRGNAILMGTPEGQARMVWVILRRAEPDFTIEKARDLSERITIEELAELVRTASPGEPRDPKSPGTTPTSPAA